MQRKTDAVRDNGLPGTHDRVLRLVAQDRQGDVELRIVRREGGLQVFQRESLRFDVIEKQELIIHIDIAILEERRVHEEWKEDYYDAHPYFPHIHSVPRKNTL